MSKKSSVIAATALVVAGVGTVAVYKYLNPGSSQPDSLATAIPGNAYMVGYISNDPQAWSKLEQFGTPAAQKIIKKQLTKLQADIARESKVDYVKDIQPWLGNVMFAALPSKDAKATEPDVIVAIGVKDKLKALDFSNKLKANAKESTKEIEYKGVKLLQSGKGQSESYSVVLDDKVLVASKRSAIEAAIDTTQGQESLAKKAGDDWFKADSLGLKQPIAAFYVPDYAGLITQSLKSAQMSSTALDSYSLEQLKKIKSIGGGIAIDEGGIRMKMVAKSDGTIPQMPNNPAKAIERFPAKTIMLAGGSGLSTLWTEVTKAMEAQPEGKKALAEMRQSFTASTKLDLDRDVFSWMGGEYAIGMLPVDKGITAAAGIGGALTIDSTNKSATDNTMNKLADMAKTSGVQVTPQKIGGKDFTTWQAAGQGSLLSYGWLDNTMVLTVGDGLTEQLANPTGETLNRNENFVASFNAIPQQKQSYFYLDMNQTMTLVNTKLMPMAGMKTPTEVEAFVNSVRGIGMAAAETDKTTTQFEALIALKKTGDTSGNQAMAK
jgi:hypothetical protein